MKKILFIFIGALLSVNVNSQQNPNSIETILPKNALIIAQTNEIKKTIISANRLINGYLNDEKMSLLKSLNEFKEKTGIDLLDYESLSDNGIDIKRKAAIAFYAADRKSKENIIIILPVYDEKAFPLKFTEVIKKMKSGGDLDAYPVVTPYKSWKIFQIRKDMFASTAGGYFILAPKGELVMNALDASVSIENSTATDTVYNNYKLNAGLSHDVNVYIKKDFLADILGPKKKPVPASDDNAGVNDNAELINAGYVIAARNKKKKTPGGVKDSSDDILNAFEYISVGASFEDNLFKLVAGANLNGSDAGAGTLLSMFTTGKKNDALYIKDYLTYSYLSMDLNAVEKYCQGNTEICKIYDDAKKEFKKNLGIDFAADFLPNFKGVINFIITDISDEKEELGKLIVFLPMNTPAASKVILDKLNANLSKGIGEKLIKKNISGVNVSIISTGEGKNKNIMFFSTDKGIFVVNDEKLVETALKAEVLGSGATSELSDNISGDMFLYTDVNPSFVDKAKGMLKKMSSKYSEVLNMIHGLNLIGRKKGSFMTFELDIELKKNLKK